MKDTQNETIVRYFYPTMFMPTYTNILPCSIASEKSEAKLPRLVFKPTIDLQMVYCSPLTCKASAGHCKRQIQHVAGMKRIFLKQGTDAVRVAHNLSYFGR